MSDEQDREAGASLPPKLLEELKAIMSMDSGEEPKGLESSVVFGGREDEEDREKDITDGVIPRRGNKSKKLVAIFSKPRAEVFDLAIPEDARAYEKVMAQICASEGRLVPTAAELPPTIVLDPAAKRGYRVITVLKWAETSMKVVDTSPPSDEISATEERKKRKLKQSE